MNTLRAAFVGAGIALVGAILSGPVGVLAVGLVHPQPEWVSSELFARSYHPIQTLPYFCGFLLVGGFVVLIAGLHRLAPEAIKARTTSAVAFSAVFAALIFLNYAIQTTYVPSLVHDGADKYGNLISALSMANPGSLGWALEMWGYSVLGVATWLCAPVFVGSALERATARLFVLNGPFSIAAALATAVWPGWVLTSAGLGAYAAWNVLITAMAALAMVILWRRCAAV